jgi:toxin ParE1/3/4
MKYGKSLSSDTEPKKTELRFSPAAEKDLLHIALYGMEQFGFEQSELYRDRLKQRFIELVESPLMYPAVDQISKGYRRSVCGVHSIYYLIYDGDVVIMRVLGRQNVVEKLPPKH